MLTPNTSVLVNELEGKVMYHEKRTKTVYVLHRMNENYWVQKNYPEDKVYEMSEMLDWSIITPFSLKEPQPANLTKSFKKMDIYSDF
uniref:Uncharacterized protein n=1 Tax=viral metagenome TaxID=1070528 RepID=A0A6C0CFX1_9ZZZZ